MVWFIYNVLFSIGYLIMLPKYLLRMRRRGGYRAGFAERFGCYAAPKLERIQARPRHWIHAVSVGEMYVALSFIQSARARDPERAFVISTNTSTGHRIAEDQKHERDELVYFPSDLPLFVGRALKRLRPCSIILVEGEIWPNLIRLAARRSVPLAMVNGRLSRSSLRGYRRIRFFISRVMSRFSVLAVQSRADGDRMVELGARPEAVHVLGSAKYDGVATLPAGGGEGHALLRRVGFPEAGFTIVGGSTWPGEEAVLLDMLERLRREDPAVRLVLVPRHAERAPDVLAELQRRSFCYVQRSEFPAEGESPEDGIDVLLVDTTGELRALYAAASAIFVGKSLTAHGGQNVIEAAWEAKPVVVGPHMENFEPVMADFMDARGLVQVSNSEQLYEAFLGLMLDADLCERLGARGRKVVEDRQGALARSAELILPRT